MVFVGVLSILGIFISIIGLIYCAIRKKPKKTWGIGLISCFVLTVFAIAMTPTSTKDVTSDATQKKVNPVQFSDEKKNVTSQEKPTQKETKNGQKATNTQPSFSVNVDGIGKIKGGISSNVGIAICEISERGTIGDEFYSERAKGKFIVVDVIITNNQKDAIMIDSSSFTLIDNQEREFSTSSNGQTAIYMEKGENDAFLSEINPGITTKISLVFDVPQNIGGLKMKAHGGMTGKEIILPLQVQKVQ